MTQEQQTTSSGKTLYGFLPGRTGPQVLLPSQMNGLIMGEPGAGKSYLFESHPGAFIFNLDRTSTSHPNPLATTWPVINNDGSFSAEMKWPAVQEVINKLIDASKNNKTPRPETIVFDSLTNMVRFIRDWTPEGLPFSSTTGKDFRELDGQMAYDFLYTTIVNTISSLRNAGYGVWTIGHTHTQLIRDKNSGNVVGEKTMPSISDSLWKRLVPDFEMVASVVKNKSTAYEEEEYTDDRNRKRKRRNKVETRTHKLSFSVRDLEPYYKARAYPEIEIPNEGAWDVFCDAYTSELQKHSLNASDGDSKA